MALHPVWTKEDVYENELLRDRLQHTCSDFAKIVDKVPTLWSCIMLETANDSRPFPLDTSKSSINQHIRKSGGRPLHIYFDLPVVQSHLNAPWCIWNALVQVSGRWSSLFLNGADACRMESVCLETLAGGAVLAGAVNLKIADITKRIYSDHRYDHPRACWRGHERVILTSNNLQIARCITETHVAFIPSACLRYLHINTDDDPLDLNWSQFFSTCTNLSELLWDKKRIVESSPVITLPSLRRLTVWTVRFLPPVFAPCLHLLEILDSTVPADVLIISDLAGLASRLTTLVLPNNPITNAVLLDILKKCPYLQRLTASDTEPRAPLLQVLARRLFYQYMMNENNRFEAIGIRGDPQKRLNTYTRSRCSELEDLCRPRNCPDINCACFMPFSRGTCVVVSGFPYPLKREHVADIYAQAHITSQTGFSIRVVKVWVAERIQFGKLPQGKMTLVILLDLEREEATFLATLGLEYLGKRYEVVCN
ncbi:hypothetical protein R3P38DRAFT_3181978 [Favolaschia claudopus]|uniref:Uncharacterized protein n=1 Tax=Favolaschia claudopus TaxID=2862362 RepID=A0AAW0CCJ4_9AGAR